ncbi:MAG: hypothetical protein ACRDQ7_27045 [Haloechinothrix sp.]
MSLEALRQLLASVNSRIADARAHCALAKSLLEESRRAIVEPQGKAEPWLPTHLVHALEQIDNQTGRLAGVSELLNRYQARL